MKTLELQQATAPLAEYARDAKKEPIILTVDGKPVAAVVSLENVDIETTTLSSNPKFMSLIERSRTRYKKEGGKSSTEVRRKLGS
jgi:antitoxin (DNA-binding transcriptional repressor) of toxin-antitoxin stability system